MIDRSTLSTPPTSLLSALKSLTKMGVGSDTHVVQVCGCGHVWVAGFSFTIT